MTEEKRERLRAFFKSLGFDALRALVAYLVFIVVGTVTGTLFALTGLPLATRLYLSPRIVYLFAFLSLSFSVYSVFRAFELYDGEAQRAFCKYERHKKL